MNYFNKLNKIIIVQIPNTIQDGVGGIEIMWRDYMQIWGAFEQINNLSPQMKSHNFSNNFYKFTVRAQHKITHKMRIIMNGRIFNIETINECKDNKSYLNIITYEKVKRVVRP